MNSREHSTVDLWVAEKKVEKRDDRNVLKSCDEQLERRKVQEKVDWMVERSGEKTGRCSGSNNRLERWLGGRLTCRLGKRI